MKTFTESLKFSTSSETVIIHRLTVMGHKINAMLKSNMSLQEITKETYTRRENGEDMIYFGWGAKSKTDPRNNYLEANPISGQKDLKKFLTIPLEGYRSLPKYTMRVFNTGVEFIKKVIDESSEEVNGKKSYTNIELMK